MKSPLNPEIDYNFELGQKLFEWQLDLVRTYPRDLLLAYSQEPLSRMSRWDMAPYIGFLVDPDKPPEEHSELEKVTISTVCRLKYSFPAVKKGPFKERIGKFYNVPQFVLSMPEKEPELRAGDIGPEIMHQIALRLEKIYAEISKYGRRILISFQKGKEDVVTPDIIDLLRSEELAEQIAMKIGESTEQIAFLSDAPEEAKKYVLDREEIPMQLL